MLSNFFPLLPYYSFLNKNLFLEHCILNLQYSKALDVVGDSHKASSECESGLLLVSD